MKAVAVMEKGKIGVVDIPKPVMREYECLVKVKACGFCSSTDLKTIDDELGSPVPFPIILGHESVGEVIEVGSKVRKYRLGDIVLNPYGRIEGGVQYNRYWSGMVEYAIIQDHEVMNEMGVDKSEYNGFFVCTIPPSIDIVDGGVILTLKENYSGLKNFGVCPGMDILIYGDGPVGLGLSYLARLMGVASIVCIGHHSERIEKIKTVVKADLVINSNHENVDEILEDRSFDLVVDAVGSTSIIKQGAKRLKPGGKVGVYGVIKKKDSNFDLLDMKNNTLLHMLNYPYMTPGIHDEVIDLIVKGVINPKDFYSHVLPMDQIEKAVELIRNREAIKVIISI